MRDTISLVLIDDNRVLCDGIAALLREQPDIRLVAAIADIDVALRTVREAKPHIVLLDLGLHTEDSLRLTATVHRHAPESRVILMGLSPRHDDVSHLIWAGASGFVMKEASFDEFLQTIRLVAAGADVLPPALTGPLFGQIAQRVMRGGVAHLIESVRLTARERQVIDLITDGQSNKEIAARLQIATHTVKRHVHNVLEKLAVHTRFEAAALARAAEPPQYGSGAS